MTHRLVRPFVLLATTIAVLAALLAAPNSAVAEEDDDPRADQAKAALAKVEQLLAGSSAKGNAHSRQASSSGHGGMTFAMRDLFHFRDALDGKDREQADAVLARPTTGDDPAGFNEPKYCTDSSCPTVRKKCSSVVCVHFVGSGPHRSGGAFANEVKDAITRSHHTYRRMGYRRPFPDGGGANQGGDQRRDIYLANLGNRGWFGYAVPEYQVGEGRGASSYLVLDNNFKEFCGGGNCPYWAQRDLMKATAAHEYFHAVQFSYDWLEDQWFMEASATWAEDVVYDGINDNRNFLDFGITAMTSPAVPIDHPDASPYGNWIFFRHLSERFGRDVVLRSWRVADAWRGYDGNRTPQDRHSVSAIARSVIVEGANWRLAVAAFGDANRRPVLHYSEGGAYPRSPLRGRYELVSDSKRRYRAFSQDHLATSTYRIAPRDLYRGWSVRVRVEGVPKQGYAIATIKRSGGKFERVRFNLGANGVAARTLPFGKAKVRWIDITVANASVRYNCDVGGEYEYYTCAGRPRDDNEPHKVVTRAFRP